MYRGLSGLSSGMPTRHCRVARVAEGALTIGVDLGGTKLLAGLVDASGAVLARERRLIGGLPLQALLDVTAEAVATVAGTPRERAP